MTWVSIITFFLRFWKPLAIIAIVGGFYLFAWHAGAAHAEQAAQRELEAQQTYARKLQALASSDYQKQLAALQKKFHVTSNQVEASLAKHLEYNSCVLPADGVRALRLAISAAGPR